MRHQQLQKYNILRQQSSLRILYCNVHFRFSEKFFPLSQLNVYILIQNFLKGQTQVQYVDCDTVSLNVYRVIFEVAHENWNRHLLLDSSIFHNIHSFWCSLLHTYSIYTLLSIFYCHYGLAFLCSLFNIFHLPPLIFYCDAGIEPAPEFALTLWQSVTTTIRPYPILISLFLPYPTGSCRLCVI